MRLRLDINEPLTSFLFPSSFRHISQGFGLFFCRFFALEVVIPFYFPTFAHRMGDFNDIAQMLALLHEL